MTPVLYNASIYKDEFGDVVGVFAAARDITERQKSEEKIQMLANVVESSDDAIISKSLDGRITSWNKGAELIYGYSAEEVRGKDISILAQPQLKDETEQFVEKIKRGDRILHYETVRVRKDGEKINVSLTLSPILDTSGDLVGISTIARDITQRKKTDDAILRAKEEWEHTFDSVPDLIAILDTNFHVIRANRAMANRLKVDPEEAIGLSCYNVVHGLSAPPSFCPHRKLIADSQEHTASL
ncbi:MAG: PAS domain S-box protein [Methanobacterium sp.]|nr:PAS domain S-box protein [Methanobacterium sp.]